MSEITRQLERDAAFMKVLPYVGPHTLAYAHVIDEVEANRISNNLAQAAREIERLERELRELRPASDGLPMTEQELHYAN